MATKVKPCRVNATGTPQAGDVPVYVNADTFQRGQASCNVKAFIISGTEAQKKQKLGDAINYYVVSGKIPLLSMDSVTYTLIKAVRGDGEGGTDDVYTFSSAVNSDTGKYKEVKVNVNSTTPISTTVNSYTVTEHSAGGGGGGSDIEYVTQAEYNALLPGALTDNKHYFIYTESGGGGWQPGVNTIAYYPLDSTNTVNDLSGNNHNGTQSGTITFGTALGVDCASFNQSGYITVPYDASLNTSTITISFWCAVSNAGTWGNINGGILCRSNLSGHGVYGVANVGAEGKNFAVQLDGGSFDQREMMFTSSNQWEYITVTYNGTTGNIYKNGSLVDTFSYTCDISQSTENLIIGTYYDSSFKFGGKLSNIIIEDQVRDATAISNYYDLTKGDYGIS